MPEFIQIFPPHDQDQLRIIAGFWHLEVQGENPHAWTEQISTAMQDPAARAEVLDALPPQAIAAFQSLVSRQGKRPWPEFAREFGEIREMGAGKRDREHPHENPASISEALHYRGLIGKVFLPDGDSLTEFVCIPEELIPLNDATNALSESILGRPAEPGIHQVIQPATDRILDHCCVLLAANRSGIPFENLGDRNWSMMIPFLSCLLISAGISDRYGIPDPGKTKTFLEDPRPRSLARIIDAWRSARDILELNLLPEISLKGAWEIDPVKIRETLLKLVSTCPKDTWWDLDSFVGAVHSHHPDLLRKAGDYERWYVLQTADRQELKGFQSWVQVEGRFISFFITILNWLGFADLGQAENTGVVTAFRICPGIEDRLEKRSFFPSPLENGKISVTSTGQILVPPNVPRVIQYQIPRYCDWGKEDERGFRYRVTSASLSRADSRGLKVKQLLSILRNHSSHPIPPALEKALLAWDKFGPQAKFDRQILLRTNQPEIIQVLLSSPVSGYLGEQLNPNTLVVKPGRERQVLDQLARLGYLGESRLDV